MRLIFSYEKTPDVFGLGVGLLGDKKRVVIALFIYRWEILLGVGRAF